MCLQRAGSKTVTKNCVQALSFSFLSAVGSTVSNSSTIVGSELNAASPSDTAGGTSTKAIRYATGGGNGTLVSEADMNSYDTDGYTFNWTTADGTARLFGFVALAAIGNIMNRIYMSGGIRELDGGVRG